MLDLGLDLTLWPWIWLVVGVVVAVIELTVLSGSLMVLPFAVSALVAALLGFAGVAIELQWLAFTVGGGILFAVFWRYQSLVQQGTPLPPGVGAVRLVGMTGVVTRTVEPDATARPGEVRVLGETWTVLADGTHLAEGTRVRVTGVEGTRIRVEPIGDDPDEHDDNDRPPPTHQSPTEERP